MPEIARPASAGDPLRYEAVAEVEDAVPLAPDAQTGIPIVRVAKDMPESVKGLL